MEGDELQRELGRAISVRRKALRLTQSQLAEAIGIEQESLSRIENGQMGISLSRLGAVAKALRCPVADLFSAPSTDLEIQGRTIAKLLEDFPPEQRTVVVEAMSALVHALRGPGTKRQHR